MTKKRSKTKHKKQTETVIDNKYYTASEFSDLEGVNSNLTFHINKKYKNEKKTIKEWKNILNEME